VRPAGKKIVSEIEHKIAERDQALSRTEFAITKKIIKKFNFSL
jgi:hypothetical protein